jgi:sulfate/thiosulfate-binding protein
VTRLYKNVPILDTGARAATVTFVERGIGDVLVAWENEALLAVTALGMDRFEIVTPSLSILAEPSVALVDKVVDKRGTREVSRAYLEFLYSQEGQAIAAKHYYRPLMASVAALHRHTFQLSACSPSKRCSAAGSKPKGCISAMGDIRSNLAI